MLNKRIKIARRVAAEMGAFGKNSACQKYELLGTFWANETWSKGVKALHEGAMDAYDTVMFRMRFTEDVDRWCLIQYNGRWYEIQSLNEDYHDNQLQITAIERANQQVTIVEHEPEPTPEPTEEISNENSNN
jgi:SPP1 family predicted phage head-tail adaptor